METGRFSHVDHSFFHDTLPQSPLDVLIVEPIPAEVQQWLASRHPVRMAPELAGNPVAARLALSTARAAILPPSVMLDASVLWHAPHLRVVGRLSAGAENIDLEACARAGVEVARGAGASAAAEAEFVVGALLAMLRRVPILADGGLLVGRELGACTVGIVGVTPNLAQLARLLRVFGAQVLGYDPAVHAGDPIWHQAGVKPVPLLDLMRSCDAVCVLLHPYSRFDGLFGERLLGAAKQHQVIVSLAHSSLFDDQALARALRNGPLAAAWLDSLEPGAQDPGRALRNLDTLQVTPRVASTTRESRLRSAWLVAQRIDDLLRADRPRRVASSLTSPDPPDSPDPAANAGPAGGPKPA